MIQTPIIAIAQDLENGVATSRQLTEEALDKIEDPNGEGSRTFIRVFRDGALAAADASDRLRAAGVIPSPLAGIPVSVKDLCDIAGVTTYAGSVTRNNEPPAQVDAPVIARLRSASLSAQLERVRQLLQARLAELKKKKLQCSNKIAKYIEGKLAEEVPPAGPAPSDEAGTSEGPPAPPLKKRRVVGRGLPKSVEASGA